jgi:hypothetical protein
MRSRLKLVLAVAGLLACGGLAVVTLAGGQVRSGSGVGTGFQRPVVSGAPSEPADEILHAQTPAAEQTRPVVVPARGGRATRFLVYFRLREEPGHRGVLATSYRLWVAPPSHAGATCRPSPLPDIASGHTGDVAHTALVSPPHGWCSGTYAVTVFLQRGPYCPKPAAGGPPTPCPEFATQDLDTGHTRFTVHAI